MFVGAQAALLILGDLPFFKPRLEGAELALFLAAEGKGEVSAVVVELESHCGVGVFVHLKGHHSAKRREVNDAILGLCDIPLVILKYAVNRPQFEGGEDHPHRYFLTAEYHKLRSVAMFDIVSDVGNKLLEQRSCICFELYLIGIVLNVDLKSMDNIQSASYLSFPKKDGILFPQSNLANLIHVVSMKMSKLNCFV